MRGDAGRACNVHRPTAHGQAAYPKLLPHWQKKTDRGGLLSHPDPPSDYLLLLVAGTGRRCTIIFLVYGRPSTVRR